jgi:maltose alpha-D-glucosyltransferase/alpha-amylase
VTYAKTKGFAKSGSGAKAPRLLSVEQSNSSVAYGSSVIFKLYRKLDSGLNPDLEIARFLTERTGFRSTPALAGFAEYRPRRGAPTTIGMLQCFVENQGDAWKLTLSELDGYFDRVLDARLEMAQLFPEPFSLLRAAAKEPPPELHSLLGPYIDAAALLGKRTAEMHVALASDKDDPEFAPVPFTTLYQRSLYQSMRGLSGQVLGVLRKRYDELPANAKEIARRVIGFEGKIVDSFSALFKGKMSAMQIRCHGDLHLGQVLYTGSDFVITDFEGEPARSLSERRLKRSPLKDVAGMLRSFQYAAYAGVDAQRQRGRSDAISGLTLDDWGRAWTHAACGQFLKSYLDAARPGGFLPSDPAQLELLLNAYLLEKAIYELGYELNNRPDWVHIPLQGILDIVLGDSAATQPKK